MQAHLKVTLKKVCHIIAALHQLIINVDVEVLPELSSSCAEGNFLLDCATALGLEAMCCSIEVCGNALQHWGLRQRATIVEIFML